MKIFDLFIRRPVLASVVSLMILLLGLKALGDLSVRQFPKLTNTVITVTTVFPGANSELMQGFVTQPIQSSIATAEGIDYVVSQSATGTSTIKVYVKLNEDPDRAMTEVMSKVMETRAILPRGIEDPVIVKTTGQSYAPLYLAFYGDAFNAQQVTDYIVRVIQPKLATVPGVASPELLGGQRFAMRVWIDPEKLAQFNISAAEVMQALQTNNYLAAAGGTKGWYDVSSTTANTDLTTVEEFRDLVVRGSNTALVRLSDLARVELGAETIDSSIYLNGEQTVVIGVKGTPEANPIEMVKAVRAMLPDLQRDLPPGLEVRVAYDATVYINDSIREVLTTIVEAGLTVMVVIFLFTGSLRSVVIPLVTVPLSLVGVCLFLLVFDFSINLLTLLAMVLAIGLVVDDAIVVVENIHRHIEEGASPLAAALAGTREIALPVVSMTLTLAAVYAPIAFTGGITGALFKEFALTLAGAVIISGIIALTLTPMMCAKILSASSAEGRLGHFIDRAFARLRNAYRRTLTRHVTDRAPTVMFALLCSVAIFGLFSAVPRELAPAEDDGWVMLFYQGPTHANTDYITASGRQLVAATSGVPEVVGHFTLNGMPLPNQGLGFLELKPLSQRSRGLLEVVPEVQQRLDTVPALRASAFTLPPLPTSDDGMPVNFVITTISDYVTLNEVVGEIRDSAMRSGLFAYLDIDLKFEMPETMVHIDRDKAAAYGVTMQAIGESLATLTGGNYVNRIDLLGRSYEVIPQAPRAQRLTPQSLGQFYVKTSSGTSIPLGGLVTIDDQIRPVALNQFNQLNSATVQAVPMPGVSLGAALDYLEELGDRVLPQGFSVDYGGQSRQYIQEGNTLLYTFIFALLVIYLVLAAQFESLRDPLVILVSVPLSVCGALIPLALGVATMNIYTQVGLVTLIGLITKHGILICEVARHEQLERGHSRAEAVVNAAAIRLRPILMTTAAMVAGSVPLLLAHGAGAASRLSIAIVIVAGMSIGTLFTLFVLPVVYTFIAGKRQPQVEMTEMPAVAGVPT